jgi:hypothetical protein
MITSFRDFLFAVFVHRTVRLPLRWSEWRLCFLNLKIQKARSAEKQSASRGDWESAAWWSEKVVVAVSKRDKYTQGRQITSDDTEHLVLVLRR